MLLSDYDWKEIELLEHLRSMLPHKVLQLSRENCRRFIERFSEREKNSNQLKMGGGIPSPQLRGQNFYSSAIAGKYTQFMDARHSALKWKRTKKKETCLSHVRKISQHAHIKIQNYISDGFVKPQLLFREITRGHESHTVLKHK